MSKESSVKYYQEYKERLQKNGRKIVVNNLNPSLKI